MAYVWIAMVGLGGILVETTVSYPNVSTTYGFVAESMSLVVSGPADFCPLTGALTVVAAPVTRLVLWRFPPGAALATVRPQPVEVSSCSFV